VAHVESWPLALRHPEALRFHRRGEGSREEYAHVASTRDPSLRLKDGFAQDDAVGEESS